MNTKVIAFYLPQYHPTPNNDKWWGKGFTEWTNVAKAKKLYPGHYQPKVPADLGFYDLRVSEVREEQVILAREAGIYGFCYYHYWFSAGHEELDLPFKEVVKTKSPDFPFCLCWANESWYSKFWNKDGSVSKKALAEQKYLGKEDNEKHFYSLLDAFKDERYIKVEGRLLFLIYQPLLFEGFEAFKQQWNELAKQNGIPEFYFVGQTLDVTRSTEILSNGFDGVNHCHRLDFAFQYDTLLKYMWHAMNVIKRVIPFPYIIPYKYAIKKCIREEDYQENIFATMMPNWDHTPRSTTGGAVLHNATPELFEIHAKDVINTAIGKSQEHQFVFLKSWNEWGEGNYMEPDMKYGKGFLKALRRAIEEVNK
ncbi:MAG: glycoside hydrolase family 99-like domain-containing protein [Paludibacteraceae bacterium]|nr:glycoside hydrolase family 99-like domain-containing protein [Paludibacteraceae bacterium]